MPLAARILDIINELRNLAPGSDHASYQVGNAYQLRRIRAYLERGEAIELVLPAFPAKSPNPRKTSGSLPDYGEVLALGRLNRLCSRIARIYAPGARLVICSDGRVFGDLVRVSDEAVGEYGRGIRDILTEFELRHLSLYNLEDVFVDSPSFDRMRARLTHEFGRPVDEIREQVKSDLEFRSLFNGIHRFLFEDGLALNPDWSRNRVREHAKELAYGVIQRSNAWSALVEAQFPDAIRLSIHPQPAHSRKIGVRLLPSDDIWRTPWHAVTLFDGSRYSLVRREEAEALRATGTLAADKYPFFVLEAVS